MTPVNSLWKPRFGFHIKILPIATYGIRLIWRYLTPRDLEKLERVKTTYLMRVLNVHRTSRNRLVFRLAGERPLIQEMMNNLQLGPTEASRVHMENWNQKQESNDP